MTAIYLLAILQAQISIRPEERPESLRIVLSWPQPVHFTTKTESRELFIQFDHALGAPDDEDLAREFPNWIEGISFGYDSMLLRTAQDMNFNAEGRESDVLIEMKPSGEDAPISAASERVAQLRLDLLQAQLLLTTGREKAALVLLKGLASRYTGEPQVTVNMAEAELRQGRWVRAKRLYDSVLKTDPENDEVPRRRDYALRDHFSRIRFDVDRKRVRGGQSEDIVELSGHHLFSNSLRLGFSAARNSIRVPNALTGERSRGEVFVQYDAETGNSVRGGLLGGPSGWGAMGQFQQPDSSGKFHVQADYRRPYWEFVEGLVGGGTRDRIEVHREQRVLSNTTARFTAAANRYGLGHRGNLANSLGFDGAVTHVVRRIDPLLGFEYAVDGEYRRFVAPSRPLPLVSREVHALSVFGDTGSDRDLRAEFSAGYAVDRLGGRGPFATGRFTYRFLRHGEAQVWFDRRLNSIATGQVVNRYGSYFIWRFE
jgi:hypothetical protein